MRVHVPQRAVLELVEGVALHLYLGLVLAQDGGEVRVLRLVALALLRIKVNLRFRRSLQHPGNCVITVYRRQNIQNVHSDQPTRLMPRFRRQISNKASL